MAAAAADDERERRPENAARTSDEQRTGVTTDRALRELVVSGTAANMWNTDKQANIMTSCWALLRSANA